VHESVARHAVPILHKIDRRRAKNLGLERLRPWDVEVGNAFIDSRSLATPQMHSAMGRTIAAALDPELGSMLDAMDRDGLLSLGTYPGKQQIRHSNCLTELRKPRIFINSDESDLGLFVLLHETGHAANAWFARQNEWFDDRQGTTTDIDEFPSNALCLLAMDKLDLVMPPLQAQAMIRWELESLIGWVVGWAKTDASMCWLYAHPQADPEERASAQAAISLRYGHDADWTGLEHFRGSFHTPSPVSWSGPSIYLAPYMMVLRLYGEYLKNPHGTYAAYKRCLSLGGSMSAPMLYAEAGLTFDFSPKVMGPVFATIDRMLE
jgi:oligoendopeptidase F